MTKLQKLNFYELNTKKVLSEEDVLAKDLNNKKQKGGFIHSRRKKRKKSKKSRSRTRSRTRTRTRTKRRKRRQYKKY